MVHSRIADLAAIEIVHSRGEQMIVVATCRLMHVLLDLLSRESSLARRSGTSPHNSEGISIFANELNLNLRKHGHLVHFLFHYLYSIRYIALFVKT